MASPQIEDGHIDIANTIADRLCSYRLSGQEWQIVWVVLRKTWGWLENPNDPKSSKKKMDRISESQFAQLTKIDRRKCHDLLQKLITKNIILKLATHKGGKTVITYGFQKNYDLWKLPTKKGAAPHKGGNLPPIKVAKLPPIKGHTKEKKETIKDKEIYKENFLGIFKTKTSIPENYSIQKEHLEYALSKKLTESQAIDQFEAFKLHHQAKGTKHQSWYAAYQLWVRNSISFGKVTIAPRQAGKTIKERQQEEIEIFGRVLP